jgi:hypothetical protein
VVTTHACAAGLLLLTSSAVLVVAATAKLVATLMVERGEGRLVNRWKSMIRVNMPLDPTDALMKSAAALRGVGCNIREPVPQYVIVEAGEDEVNKHVHVRLEHTRPVPAKGTSLHVHGRHMHGTWWSTPMTARAWRGKK